MTSAVFPSRYAILAAVMGCLLAWSLSTPAGAVGEPAPPPAALHQLRQPVTPAPGAQLPASQPDAAALTPDPAQAQERVQAMTDILDIKPPLALPANLLWLWLTLAGLATAALVAALWWWRRRRAKAAAPPPTPQECAIGELERLESRLDSPARVFYFDLSAVFRGYVEAAFGLRALEMTGEELYPRLAGLPLPSELLHQAQRFIRAADPVKYAGLDADLSTRRDDLEFVRRFVAAPTTPEVDHV